MKFSCDSCGAQYLIADDKIGPRGVKVRCKKCSHVIILKPGAVADGGRALMTGGSASQVAVDTPVPATVGASSGPSSGQVPVAPSVAAERARASESSLPADVVAATSSDLGLSREFQALGFDEGDGPAARQATLSVGLDLDETPSGLGDTSPFGSGRAGGSLDFVPPPEGPADASEQTAVSARPGGPLEDEETELLGDSGGTADLSAATERAQAPAVEASGALGEVGLGAAPPRDDDDDGDVATRVEDLSALAKAEADDRADDVHEDEDATQVKDDREDAPGFDAPGLPAPDALRPPPEDDSEGVGDEAAALSAALSAELGDFDAEEGAAPRTLVGPPPEAEDEAGSDEPPAQAEDREPSGSAFGDALAPASEDSIADEIGSAFEAMFEGQGGFGGDPNSIDAVAAALGADETNKLETRVFDTEAMARVEAEQERAAATIDEPAAESPKEWYVAIDDEQVGPLNREEVEAHWQDGRLAPTSLCWRAGMADWTALQFVEALADLVPPEPEPRVPTVLEGPEATGAPPSAAADEDEPADDAVDDAPPRIAPDPTPDLAPAPARAADEDLGWRPSAASALASLAAEELSQPDPPRPNETPSAVAIATTSNAGALPASDALEKLLESGAEKSAASQFGAAEKSESYVRPLPRRADTVSSVPLRDPTVERPKRGWVVPVAILLGAVIVTGGLYAVFGPRDAPVPAVAQAPTVPTSKSSAVVAPPAPAPAEAASPEASKDEAAAPGAPDKEAVDKAADEPPEPEKKAAKPEEAPPKKKPTRRRRRRRTSPPPPPPPPARAERARPPPTRAASVEDDLLGAAAPAPARRRRVAPPPPPALPDQLDESDVFGVLRNHRGDVKRCLDQQASADPSLAGTMTVELVIRGSGRTKSVRVKPDKFKSSVAGQCMIGAVRKWRFPKFSGSSMPLDFPVRVRGR